MSRTCDQEVTETTLKKNADKGKREKKCIVIFRQRGLLTVLSHVDIVYARAQIGPVVGPMEKRSWTNPNLLNGMNLV